MSRIILHVGTHKTGSTTIQRTLNKHRSHLQKLGITLFEGSNHSRFHRCFIDCPESFHRNFRSWDQNPNQEDYKQALRKYFSHHKNTTHLISSEDLSLLSERSLTKLRDFLIDDCECTEIDVVCFMRNPLDYLNSSLQQYIKPGLVSLDEIIRNSFLSYRFQGFPSFDGGSQEILSEIYFPIPGKLIRVFGKENTRFFSFELSKNDGLVRSLLSWLPGGSSQDWPRDSMFNVSMSHESCILLAEYNSRNPLFFRDLTLNRSRVNSRLVPILRNIPGRRPALLNQDSIDLDPINCEIESLNTLVGSLLIKPVHSFPEKFRENELTYFSVGAIKHIRNLFGWFGSPPAIEAGKLDLREIENINSSLDRKFGRSWWGKIINARWLTS